MVEGFKRIGYIFDLKDGAKRDRTADLLLAKQALSHLSYGPLKWTLGASLQNTKRKEKILSQVLKMAGAGFEPTTFRL